MTFFPPMPGEKTIAALLKQKAAEIPHEIYGIFPDTEIRFGELDAEARRIARGLIGLGIRPGDHVATLMPNHAHWVFAYFGALYAGATVVALNARYKKHELAFTIAHSDARVLITTDAIEDYVPFAGLLTEQFPEIKDQKDRTKLKLREAPDLTALILMGQSKADGFLTTADLLALGDDIADACVDAAIDAVGPGDPAAIIYTSGTTSNPKGCVLSHAGLQRSWYTFADIVDLLQGQRVWMPMPFYHTGGIGPMTAYLSRGAAFVTQPHFNADGVIALMGKYKIDHLYPGFPQMSLAVLQHPSYSPEDFPHVRSLLNVGPPAMQVEIDRRLPNGAVVLNLFGMTEGSGIVTFTPMDTPLDLRATSSGLPPPHTEIRIVDPESGAVLEPGQQGEIQFRGGGAFLEYYRDPEATALTIMEGGWVRTGDRGKIDEMGYLYYLGRLKDMLKVGGENVAAAEIEFFLSQHPDVKMVQVIGGADDRLGEVPIAFVERTQSGSVSAAQLIAMCDGQLAKWKIPRDVIFVTEWPLSTTKVQKFRLKELLPDHYRSS